jgi:hypothetical protein
MSEVQFLTGPADSVTSSPLSSSTRGPLLGIKTQGHGTNHSDPCNSEIKNILDMVRNYVHGQL